MSCAVILQDASDLFICADTAACAKINGEYKRIDGEFSKVFSYKNHIYFVSGEYNASMMARGLIENNVRLNQVIRALSKAKSEVEIIDCYFDEKPVFDDYCYIDGFKKQTVSVKEGIMLNCAGVHVERAFKIASKLYGKLPIIDWYKRVFSVLSCEEIGGDIEIYHLNKDKSEFITKEKISDKVKPVNLEVNSKWLLIAETIVGNLIAGNNLTITNSTGSFSVDANGAVLENSSFSIQNDKLQIRIDPEVGLLIKNIAGGADETLLSASMVDGALNIKGMLTFQEINDALGTAGKTTINGANITTGQIRCDLLDAGIINHANSYWNLGTGEMHFGPSSGTRVVIDSGTINWYYQNNLTGVLHSVYAKTYIGCNSENSFFGWFSSAKPNFGWSGGGQTDQFCGIEIQPHVHGTNTYDRGYIHCCAGKFEVAGLIECNRLIVNGNEIK